MNDIYISLVIYKEIITYSPDCKTSQDSDDHGRGAGGRVRRPTVAHARPYTGPGSCCPTPFSWSGLVVVTRLSYLPQLAVISA